MGSHPGGLQSYSYPVLIAGHGLGLLHTVIMINRARDRAFIVQADLEPLCGMSTNEGVPRVYTPLCHDTQRALTDIALAVARIP